MMKPMIESHLSAVLTQHGIKPYGLAKAIRARYGDSAISQPTVYAVTKGNGMPDARTIDQIMHALTDMTGTRFELADLFAWKPDPEATA